MNLCVIGSTGRTGRHVVEQAVRRGHQVTAFTRRSEVSGVLGELATVVHGDGRDAEAIAQAVSGADAVIAIVGAESRKGPHQTAEVARVVTTVMAEPRVPRLVITSAYPLVATKPRLAIAVLQRLLAAAYADMRAMEQIVTSSDLDWRIVRLNRLTGGPARGRAEVSPDGLDKASAISRADVAAILLDIAEADRYSRCALNVGGAGR